MAIRYNRLEHTLKKLSDTILLNAGILSSTGINNGSFGNLLFLYEYDRFKANDLIYELTNRIFLSSIEKVGPDISFLDGLSGIGISICSLIEADYITMSNSKIFDGFDHLLSDSYKFHSNSIDCFGAALYNIYRLKMEDNLIDYLRREFIILTMSNIADALTEYISYLEISMDHALVFSIPKFIEINSLLYNCRILLQCQKCLSVLYPEGYQLCLDKVQIIIDLMLEKIEKCKTKQEKTIQNEVIKDVLITIVKWCNFLNRDVKKPEELLAYLWRAKKALFYNNPNFRDHQLLKEVFGENFLNFEATLFNSALSLISPINSQLTFGLSGCAGIGLNILEFINGTVIQKDNIYFK
ncbi:MAG: hypothetical protein LBJ04_03915 [Sphingobacterium sp.]|jgi:hypothetical protein|nr:hypothetical protein [Sphingobacterium sp.]